FWESDADAGAYVHVSDPKTGQNLILSEDSYWMTDNSICSFSQGGRFFGGHDLSPAQCHLAANYGRSIDRLRSLQSPSLASTTTVPIWGFVELGHPFGAGSESWPTIRPEQVRAAVWSMLIHGARGIEYFNHSFAGNCQSQHILRDPCYASMRTAVTALN